MRKPTITAAFALDAALVRLARSRGAVELAIGETLLELFRGSRLLDLGYARKVDYARERLGVPPRTMFLWLRLAKGLASRPVLRSAVVRGAVSPRKALAVLPVAEGLAEEAWTAAAMSMTLRDLDARVRAAGREPETGLFPVETLVLAMTPAQQDRLDAAIEVAREVIGHGAPRWQCLEAICMEWLGAFGGHAPEGEPEPPLDCDRRDRAEPLARQLAAIEEAADVVEPTGLGDVGSLDAWTLDARARRLLEARRGFDEPFGRLLARAVRTKLHRVLGYRTLEEYCRERLGMSPRTVRQRVWLERRMGALPELREALSAGRLTLSKALIVARDATPDDVSARIAEAVSTTWQQLERESTAREDRQNRARGVRRLWGPEDA
ncbi:MAG: HNH endonuclease, partial [Planctomycetota bacterium]